MRNIKYTPLGHVLGTVDRIRTFIVRCPAGKCGWVCVAEMLRRLIRRLYRLDRLWRSAFKSQLPTGSGQPFLLAASEIYLFAVRSN